MLFKKEKIFNILIIFFVNIFLFSCSKEDNPSKPPEDKKKPTITLNLDSLQFEANQNEELPSDKSIAITTSIGTLDWSISANQSWITLTPTSGTGSTTITISINTTNKDTGTYNATITVISRDASNSPLTIKVSFIIKSTKVYWEKINCPFAGTQVSCLVLQSDGKILAGTAGNGIYRSTDDGSSWTQIGLSNYSVSCITINSKGYILAGTDDGHGIYKSIDNGINWMQSNEGIIVWKNYDPIYSIFVISNELIFAGGDSFIYISTNNGNSWNYKTREPVSTGGIRSFIILPNGNIIGALYSPRTEGIYCGILRTTDNGENWSKDNSIHLYVLTLIKNSQGQVFAGTYWKGIYKSADGTDNWIYSGLTGELVNTIAINSKDYIFTGTTHGVFISKNNGETWNAIHNGLQGNGVYSLVINSKGYLIAGTWSGGIYRTLIPSTDI